MLVLLVPSCTTQILIVSVLKIFGHVAVFRIQTELQSLEQSMSPELLDPSRESCVIYIIPRSETD